MSRREALGRCGLALLSGAASLALLPATALAQLPMGMHLGGDKAPPSKEELERRQALDKAYNAANQKIPEKKQANDPWGNIRAAPGTSASAKDKPKPKP